MGSAITDGWTIEVVVDGRYPVVTRAALVGAMDLKGRWVVLTDQPAHHPGGEPPVGGVLVTTAAVTEAVKDTAGGHLVGSVDRAALVEVIVPVKLAIDLVGEVLAANRSDPVDVVRAVAALGGVVAEALPA